MHSAIFILALIYSDTQLTDAKKEYMISYRREQEEAE